MYTTLSSFLLVYFIKILVDSYSGPDIKNIFIFELPQVFVCSLAAFLISSSYKSIIRHTGFRDITTVLYANFLYLIFMYLLLWVNIYFSLPSQFQIGKINILIHFFLNTLALVSLRLLYKTIYSKYIIDKGGSRIRRILIYGAGASGVLTYNVLEKEGKGKINILGFIDDKKKKQGKKIDGLRIFDPLKITSEFLNRHKIDEIIISIQNISPIGLSEIVEKFSETEILLKIVPPVSDWLNGNLTLQQIKPVKVEDLLGRDIIELNKDDIAREIFNKTVLVTGAAGSIGSEISRQLMLYSPKKLILLDQAESDLYNLQQQAKSLCRDKCIFKIGDIRNKKTVELVVGSFRPDIIFHAAAYKHVPLMEDNPYQAISVNVKGTKILSDAAVKFGVKKFVMISTDKAVNPTNIMGVTKRVAELYVCRLNEKRVTNFIVTRFGNVLGSNGSVIPLFKRQIQNGGPLTVTHPEITRYFMTIPEACQLVLEAGAMGNNGEVFVFDMGKPVKIIDLAKKIIQLSGLRYPDDIDIEIVGLRPGEKIFEELLANGENTIKTHHPKIMVAKVNSPGDDFEALVKELIAMELFESDLTQSKIQMAQKLKEIVPEYQPQNTIYSFICNDDKDFSKKDRMDKSLTID